MIYVFRKEIRKWYPILWLVFISLAISGVYGFFFSRPGGDIVVGTVNGEKIIFSQYRRSLAEVYARIESFKNYASQYGIPSDFLIASILRGKSPEQFAIEQCVENTLIKQIDGGSNISLDQEWFKNEVSKSLPPGIIDENGLFNMDIYRGYLQRMGLTPAQFEEEKEDEFKRAVVMNALRTLNYVPGHEEKRLLDEKNKQKKFSILVFNLDDYVKKAKEKAVLDEELKLYFERHKENYRVPEKCKVSFWDIDVENYGQSIVVDEEAIKRFYDRNKTDLFRTSPTVIVKRILLSATQETRPDVYKKAKDLQSELKKNPDLFDARAKELSSLKDNQTMTINGRGNFDSDTETAAFRLHNPGDISSVVRTNKGYEVLKLISRESAKDKPIDDVRDEIIKTIKARRAINDAKSDLEQLVRTSKEDSALLGSFVEKHKLKEQKTDWLTANQQAKDKTVESELSQKIFSKRSQEVGFISYNNNFVLYKIIDRQPSIIPALDSVKDEVETAFYETKGLELLSADQRLVKSDLLSKNSSRDEIAKTMNLRHIETKLLSSGTNKGTDIDELKHISGLKNRLFILSGEGQVFSYSHNREYILAQLIESKIDEKSVPVEVDKEKIIKKEKMSGEAFASGALIASLHRNAKIEFNEQLLGINKHK